MPRLLRAALSLLGILAVAVGVALGDPPAGYAPPHGPPLGDVRYTAKIQAADGAADVDDYVGGLRAGEVLSAALVVGRNSLLVPSLQVIDPDGGVVSPRMAVSKTGKSIQMRSFRVPRIGRWTVRVSGLSGTQGEYSITFGVRPAPAVRRRGQHLGDDQPQFKIHEFGGLDGSLLDLTLTWTARSLPIEIRSMTDPRGDDLLTPAGGKAADAGVTDLRRRTLTLSDLPLHTGDGDYSVRVRTPQGASTYDVTFAVTPVGRPKGRRRIALNAPEPFLEPHVPALRGRPGFDLRLRGRNFSTRGEPRVFFGQKAGTVVSVAADGTFIDVLVPQGVPGTMVPVAVENPDGQSAVRADHFFYIQPIRVLDLVDDAGTPVRAGSSRGGRALHLKGEFFEAGQTVKIGDGKAQVMSVVDPTEMLIVTGPGSPGSFRVIVTDVFGGVAASDFDFLCKAPPTFGSPAYSPSVAAVNSQVLVTIKGKDFEAADQLTFAGAPMDSTFVDATSRTFTAPARSAGAYAVTLTDSIGTVERGPDFTVKPPPTITSVAIVAGARVGTTGLPVTGGSTIQVEGANFHETDAVTLGGIGCTATSHTATRFTFDAPAGSLGPATLSVIDGAYQGTTLPNAFRYVGYSDATATGSPGGSTVDDLNAERMTIGDLDGDGAADDVVLVTSTYSYYGVGSRYELTRLFFGDSSGHLVDATAANFPAAGTDTSLSDDWNASAVVVGDVDGGRGADILIGGVSPYYNVTYKSIRFFRNDGAGKFTQDEIAAPPTPYTPAVYAFDPANTKYMVFGTVFEGGNPKAMALGDLDHDGDADLVVGRDHYELHYVGIDPTKVNFAVSPPYVATYNVAYLSYFRYRPGTKVYENDLAHSRGFLDVTVTALPAVGDSLSAPTPCFQAQDLVLGDVDRDGWLDIVETWDDPTTVSAYGTYKLPGVDVPRVCTRVLRNNHAGRFTDVTSTWMPAPASPEFWQANRLVLADLDKDGTAQSPDLDLVLVHFLGTDAFNTKPPSFSATALRILRNDGTRFVDVTASAVPALPGNGDNFRGNALAVRDVDGDGWADIVLSTAESMSDTDGNPMRSTRLFRGGPGLRFTHDDAFLVAASTDSGEASDVLLGDLAGSSDPVLILTTSIATPRQSQAGERLRLFDWHR